MIARKDIGEAMVLAAAVFLSVVGPVLAADNTGINRGMGGHRFNGQSGQVPGIFGTVAAVSGNTITVTAKQGPNSTTATTYSVDATNAKITKDNATSSVSNIATGDTVSVRGTISGTNVVATEIRDGQMMGQGRGIFGTVAAVSGNTITVTAKQGPNSTTATTYSVDATNAKITKDNAAGTIASILAGDTVSIQGAISGSNVTATTIRDGQMPVRNAIKGQAAQTPVITGNGQPVVAGTVSSIGDNSITITNKSNVTYTIDTANAKITQGQSTIQLSGVKTGDAVVVQGAVNGTSVVASSVIDQTRPANSQTVNTDTSNTTNSVKHPQSNFGFLGAIGEFFKKLFGF